LIPRNSSSSTRPALPPVSLESLGQFDARAYRC